MVQYWYYNEQVQFQNKSSLSNINRNAGPGGGNQEGNSFIGRLLTIRSVPLLLRYFVRDIECYMCLFLFISMFTWSYSLNLIEINLQTIQISTCTNNHYTEIFWFCSPAEELRFVTDEDGKDAHDVISLKNTLPYPIAYKVNMFNKFWIHMDAIFLWIGQNLSLCCYSSAYTIPFYF